jgi:hypothetical protein
MDPLILRFLERFIVVLFSGLSIYLGFRLFLEVPEHKNASGQVTLPWNTSVVMSRIGPGAFFALFGVIRVSPIFARKYTLRASVASDRFSPSGQTNPAPA